MGIIASSPTTVRQFQPSDANSIVFLSAIECSSCLSHQRRLRTRSEYSERMGMGTTETCSSNATSECSGTADESYLRGTEKGWIKGRGATPQVSTSTSSTTPKRRNRRDRISRPLAVDGLLRDDVWEVASILDWTYSLDGSTDMTIGEQEGMGCSMCFVCTVVRCVSAQFFVCGGVTTPACAWR